MKNRLLFLLTISAVFAHIHTESMNNAKSKSIEGGEAPISSFIDYIKYHHGFRKSDITKKNTLSTVAPMATKDDYDYHFNFDILNAQKTVTKPSLSIHPIQKTIMVARLKMARENVVRYENEINPKESQLEEILSTLNKLREDSSEDKNTIEEIDNLRKRLHKKHSSINSSLNASASIPSPYGKQPKEFVELMRNYDSLRQGAQDYTQAKEVSEDFGLRKLRKDLGVCTFTETTATPPRTREQGTQTDNNNRKNKTNAKEEIPAYIPNTNNALSAKAVKNYPTLLKQAMYGVQQGKDFKGFKRFLLVGPSGTGKTTIAESVAAEYGMPLFFHSGTLIVNSYKNSGNQNIKTIFKQAIAQQPCVLVIDELNELFEKHERTNDSDQGMLRTFWTMIDECQKHNIIFIGTFNSIKELPSQIRTRFPAIFKIDLPGEKERSEAIDFHMDEQCSTNNIAFEVDIQKIAQKTHGFSLREIASLVDLASLQAFFVSKDSPVTPLVTTDDLLKAIPEIRNSGDAALDKTSAFSKETLSTAAHYGFQITSAAGQMYFQKWMQDRQMNHTNMLHEDSKAHQTGLHEDGKLHQDKAAEKQNSNGNIAKNAAISSGISTAISFLGSIAYWWVTKPAPL